MLTEILNYLSSLNTWETCVLFIVVACLIPFIVLLSLIITVVGVFITAIVIFMIIGLTIAIWDGLKTQVSKTEAYKKLAENFSSTVKIVLTIGSMLALTVVAVPQIFKDGELATMPIEESPATVEDGVWEDGATHQLPSEHMPLDRIPKVISPNANDKSAMVKKTISIDDIESYVFDIDELEEISERISEFCKEAEDYDSCYREYDKVINKKKRLLIAEGIETSSEG